MLVEPKGFRRSPLLEDPKTRYFVITSNVGENVVKSVQHSVWATQRKNEQKLNDAYRSSTAVVLIFSVNRSGAFQGYARMRSLTGRATCRSDPFSGFGRLFNVEWLRLHDIEVAEVNHLRNPLDESRQVGFSRDGQELAHDVGAELCRHFDVQVFKEDPESYEPVTDERPPVEPQAGQPPQLALPAPTGAMPGEQSPAVMQGPPGILTAPQQPMPQRIDYLPGPCSHPAPAPQMMQYPPPPGYGYHPYGPPPWAAPPPVLVRGDPRQGHHRGRRRRRSYSSYSTDGAAPKKSKKKKEKKRRKEASRNRSTPDFENMSYEEYVEWWRKTHTPGLPGQSPAPSPAVAQAPQQQGPAQQAVPGPIPSSTSPGFTAAAPREQVKPQVAPAPVAAPLRPDGLGEKVAIPPPGTVSDACGPRGAGGGGACPSTPSADSDLPEGEPTVESNSPVPGGVYQ